MSIYSNIGKKYKSIEDTLQDIIYDNNYDVTPLLDKINIENIKNTQQKTILQTYYEKYGYTSLLSTVGGYIIGTKSASDILTGGISALVPGVSRDTITSHVLDATNTIFNSKHISTIIDDKLPSLNLFNINNSNIVPAQIIPGERFLSNSIGNSNSNSSSVLNLVGGTLKSAISDLITNAASTGTATVYNITKTLQNGINSSHIEKMSSQGLKYTQNVGFLDPTMDRWKTDSYSNHTFDKYSGYKDKNLKYDNLINNSNSDKSEIIDRYKKIFGETTSEYSATNYDYIYGNNTQNRKSPDEKYLDNKTINVNDEKISPKQFLTRLGFPIVNGMNNLSSNSDTIDLINNLDVGENYSETLRDSIKFIIEDISSSTQSIPIIFRATVNNISDTVNSEWDSVKFVGRADSLYRYTGFNRSINFDITVYINSVNELVNSWRKINRLYGLCYPISYENRIAMKSPIIKLTIGDLYSGVYCKIDSVSISPHAESMWEIEDGYQLPHVVDISLNTTVIYESNYINDNNNNIQYLPPTTNSHHFIHNKEKFRSLFDNTLTEGLQ